MPDKNGQDEKELWNPFRFFLGSWRGNGDGMPGFSQAERVYILILNDRFI